MKKSLYQILGVDPKASTQEIEAAYNARIDELKSATLQDPNKLRVLQQSKAVLVDAAQRATYDASIATGATPAAGADEREPPSPLVRHRAKWMAAAVILAALFLFWPRRAVPPPLPPVKPVATMPAEPAPQAAAPDNAAPVVSAEPPPALPVNPLQGEWSCTDAISGRGSKYNFQQDGILRISAGEGQATDYRYELSGKTLTLADTSQASTLEVEELTTRKMILNTGAEGRRVVCRR